MLCMQMLQRGIGTTECLQACEVLQQMCQLSDSMATSVLHEGALWRLCCLLMSFRDLLLAPQSDALPAGVHNTKHATPQRRPPSTAAVATMRAGARACMVLLQRCAHARVSFVAMGGLHATMHLLRDLQVLCPGPEINWML